MAGSAKFLQWMRWKLDALDDSELERIARREGIRLYGHEHAEMVDRIARARVNRPEFYKSAVARFLDGQKNF